VCVKFYLSVLDQVGQKKIKINKQDPKKRAPFLKTPEKQGSGVITW
jgi:hypothetical protein